MVKKGCLLLSDSEQDTEQTHTIIIQQTESVQTMNLQDDYPRRY